MIQGEISKEFCEKLLKTIFDNDIKIKKDGRVYSLVLCDVTEDVKETTQFENYNKNLENIDKSVDLDHEIFNRLKNISTKKIHDAENLGYEIVNILKHHEFSVDQCETALETALTIIKVKSSIN